ncbi:uncharacterized protein L3040_004810 [Drepanopeziza brunnea f. sp. 'multigermtubi']|uniref:uncharacterized protein n=1 Tax=Drepanopeziza brunnea f. sp. 'multigermtubi' TaxID=698441 RepID=UPI0023A34423|nr:hypothetical protein L3040_004810 [Drepanopeziza brunnea f. sp. 'multigermtubi']
MSQKSIYKGDIDFSTLALQDRDFAKVLKPNGQLDFSNPESVQQLTKSLLRRDFSLEITLPPDRLCPPVPNRLNYILWIQSLLDSTSDSYTDRYDPEREVLGLDVGTGASCIYPLLGCSQRPNWRFAGTDTDDRSFQFAKKNVQDNGLQTRIKLLQTQPDGLLLPLDQMGFDSIDFTMCNPPFYTSTTELLASAASKQRPPFTACTGSESEMVTPGGEVTFASRMIDESLVLKDRVQWYTSMLGKFSSIEVLVKKLQGSGVDNYAVTEFVQGSKTRRWAIGWSFEDLRPGMGIARGVGTLQKGLLPFPGDYVITSRSNQADVGQKINTILGQLPMKWRWKSTIYTGIGFSGKAVWSRAARRHVTKSHDAAMEDDSDEEEMAFGCKVQVEANAGGVGGSKITIRWLKGHDSVLFESFCGMLKRKIEEEVK